MSKARPSQVAIRAFPNTSQVADVGSQLSLTHLPIS